MHPALAADWLLWLENTPLALSIRQSLWLYPMLEIIHITGIAILVGGAILFDLRLLGFSTQLPVVALAQHLLFWSKAALVLVVPSGLLLFLANAQAIGLDPIFWLKMLLLALAGLNALVFHVFTFTNPGSDQPPGAVCWKAKAAALVSAGIWLAIITCGRLLAY